MVYMTCSRSSRPKVFSCEFCEISKNTFSHRTPPVATSDAHLYLLASNITQDVNLTGTYVMLTCIVLPVTCYTSHPIS